MEWDWNGCWAWLVAFILLMFGFSFSAYYLIVEGLLEKNKPTSDRAEGSPTLVLLHQRTES